MLHEMEEVHMGYGLLHQTILISLRVFRTLYCTVLYDHEVSLEGLPIYILRNCQFPSENLSLKRNDGDYRMLVSSMKITCCLHNICMLRSSKCRISKGMAVCCRVH